MIGMLTYLCTSTRPGIAFAAHQCAHFCTSPKCSHELAVCQIIPYLKGAGDHGYILLHIPIIVIMIVMSILTSQVFGPILIHIILPLSNLEQVT
jgi:hypothetical protein